MLNSGEPPVPISILAEPNGMVAEAFRNLRVALSKYIGQQRSRFLVVSAFPGDGKSNICVNLAAALGQLHLRVLLVDGDLRRPTISRVFSAQNLVGLTDSLDQASQAKSYKTRIPNLELVPRGTCDKNPANLLNPDR